MEAEHVSEFMENGLAAWRNRALTLRQGSTLASQSSLADVPRPGENEPLLSKQAGATPAQVTGSRGDAASAAAEVPGKATSQVPEEDRTYFASLSRAPPSALIHLILEYHQSLIESGQQEKAQKIAKSLAALREPEGGAKLEQDLHGMDLLLKDGLLQFLLRINPYLPNLKSQVVRFKDLTLSVKREVPHGFETLGKKALGIAQGPLKKKPQMVDVDVLQGVSGYIMPGSFMLVLGPPGCGKSSLHKVLAGRLGPSKGTQLSGSVTFNGRPSNEVFVQRLVGVVDASDFHLPHLTVKETMEFARDFTQFWTYKNYGPELKEIMGEPLEMGLDPKLEMNMSMTGLNRIQGRIAGGPTIPSTTADERHRLSVAEMISGTYAVYCFDELNEGVDAKVTYDLVMAVLIFARVRQCACLISLQQPSPETFELFDRVMLLDHGRVVFQGPRLDALAYFATLGYKKPPQMETSEFLQEVTTEEGLAFLQPGFPRLDSDGFAAAFEKSDLQRHILQVVESSELTVEVSAQAYQPLGLKVGPGPIVASLAAESPLGQVSLTNTLPIKEGDTIVAVGQKCKVHEGCQLRLAAEGLEPATLQERLDEAKGPVVLHTVRPYHEPDSVAAGQFESEYIKSVWYEMWYLTKRQVLMHWRNKFTLYARAFQIVLLSLYTGTLFFQMNVDANQLDANLRRGVGFSSLMTNTLINLGQFPALFEGRNVYYKQQAARFFRPFSYWFGLFAGGAVYSMLEATTWAVLVYFISGLSYADGGWHFWVYYLIVSLIMLQGSAMVRFIAFLAPDLGVASAIAGIFIAMFVLFAGFLVSRFKVPPYWIWMYYINPLQWGINAILINEFNSSPWKHRLCTAADIPEFPQCKNRIGQSLGHAYLARGQFFVDPGWIAVAVGVLLAWNVIWNVLAYLCIARVRHIPPLEEGAMPSKEVVKRQESKVFKVEDEEYAGEMAMAAQKGLPFIPVTLSWHDLSYGVFIPQIQQSRTVLHEVSGWARPGEMLALLGLTGAGKTTLLDALAGRHLNPEQLSGQVLVNGFPREAPTFAHVVGFVDRHDAYWPFTTVREALEFNAAMRLGKKYSATERRAFVDQVLELMEVRSMQNRLLVSFGSRLAREQQRRVTVGIELAGNPSVLLLDEPTSGMDSRAAVHVVHCLKNVAGTGRTIIATLNRPSMRMASVFDNALLMKRGGECVYFGSLGPNCRDLQLYFESIPGTPRCDPDVNPITFAMDCIGDGIAEQRAMRRDYSFEYGVSRLALENTTVLEGLRRSKGTAGPQLVEKGYGASYWLQARETIVRLQNQYWRNLHYSFGRFMSAILLGLLIGSVFWQENINSSVGANARAGQLFISSLLFAVANAGGVIPQIVSATAAYKREYFLNSYSTFFYNLSWGLAEIPYLALITLIFCSISFGMSGLAMQTVAAFFQVWFIFFEFVLCMTFVAMFLAVTVSFPPLASVVVPIIISLMVPTGGLVLVKRRTSDAYVWDYWINPLQYALNAMTSITFFCETQSPQCMNNGQNMACLNDPSACPLCPCQRVHDSNNTFVWTFLKINRSLNHGRVGLDMMVLALYIVIFRFLSFLALKYLRHNRRT